MDAVRIGSGDPTRRTQPERKAGSEGPRLRLGEGVLRRLAQHSVIPEYPQVSRKKGATGVAVAELVTDVTGSVRDVTVLQAPDEAIAEAVAAAVRQWRFAPRKVRGQAVPLVGKLTFYFRQRGKAFVVESPSSLAPISSGWRR